MTTKETSTKFDHAVRASRLAELGYDRETLREAILDHCSDPADTHHHPCVYCGTRANYLHGDTYGAWIDISTFYDYDEYCNFCLAIHADEIDPELMFQSCACLPAIWHSETLMSRETFDRIKHYREMCDYYDNEVLNFYVANFDDPCFAKFDDRYEGYYGSELGYAMHIADDCYDIESALGPLAAYFDYKAFARALFLTDYSEINGHIFNRTI